MPDLLRELCERYGVKESSGAVALDYMKSYGHYTEQAADPIGEAVARVQTRLSLPVTGELDRSTLREMLLPRCGLPDYQLVTAQSRWNRSSIAYTVDSYVGSISQADQEDLIRLGLEQWAEVCELSFQRVDSRNQANIVVGTGSGRASGFDGPFGTLAWANLPQGDDRQLQIVFDLEETWVKSLSQGQRAILFLNVMCHEAGHALGLDHSSVRKALMYPTYDPSIAKPQEDDTVRIQRLYGKPTGAPRPKPTPAVSEIWLRGADGNWLNGYKVSENLY